MARKPTAERPRSSNVSRTGFEKMHMSHQRMRKQIQRIQTENAERQATGKPVHAKPATRR